MSQTFGKTRWKRFAVVMVPTLAATAAVGVSIAQGALAASFALSGASFKVEAGTLHGNGFSQYGTVDTVVSTKDGSKAPMPVAVSGFNSATITNLCQSVDVPMPWGDYTLRILAGDAGTPVQASKLYIDMTDLKADTATFNNINIGVAGGAISKGPVDSTSASQQGFAGSFGQEADSADLTNVKQTAWATSAGTFALANMHLNLSSGSNPCF
ncbi:DUF6230 family protein [Streptacidiphilus neutrinimicus]|uniref:DUF6230 family protein n=1 Tax=Streptacidiphilus neutrinimicus TaxID=105420 RepID=UPI000AB77083|nr:DUF6230 family protein [Streptacidiphilus neutrinimicus]